MRFFRRAFSPRMPRVRGCVFPLTAACVCIWLHAITHAQTPWEQGTIYRDRWGIPHITADTLGALGFLFGYAQAEDHAESMLLAYRMAKGQLAEVIGSDGIPYDEFALKVGHGRVAASAWPNLDPVTQELCASFAAGVNAWMTEHPTETPPWATEVVPQDIVAFWHAFLTSMAPFDLPGVYRPPRPFDTGNAWALAPQRTQEGHTILAAAMHESYGSWFRWYEAHLRVGDYDVLGATLFGLPILLIGHNAQLGWILTPNYPDTADVFREEGETSASSPKSLTLKPSINPEFILLQYMSQSVPYRVRTEDGYTTRWVPAGWSTRGPLFDKGGALFSWLVGGFSDLGGIRQLFEMGRAQNLAQFQNALSLRQLPCFHLLYADKEGNLYYLYQATTGWRDAPPTGDASSGTPPAPAAVVDFSVPLSSQDAFRYWKELVPLELLPQVTNPRQGYLQICGTPPWGVADELPYGPAQFPRWFVQDRDSYRAQRARQLLRAGTRSFRDMQMMLYDTYVPAAAEFVPGLLTLADRNAERVAASHPDAAEGLQILRNWRFLAEPSSTGMTFFHAWWLALRLQFAESMQNDEGMYRLLRQGGPAVEQAALDALAHAARFLRNEFQRVAVPWETVHCVQRGDKTISVGGAMSGEPLFVMSDTVYHDHRWYAAYGCGYLMTVQFRDPPETYSVVAFGSSERPGSEHFHDQLALLSERRLKRVFTDWDRIAQQASSATGQTVLLYPPCNAAVQIKATRPLRVSVTPKDIPPDSLPDGWVPIMPYLQITTVPAESPYTLTAFLRLDASACTDAEATSLAWWQWSRSSGWAAVSSTLQAQPECTLVGAAESPSVVVVLGPEQSELSERLRQGEERQGIDMGGGSDADKGTSAAESASSRSNITVAPPNAPFAPTPPPEPRLEQKEKASQSNEIVPNSTTRSGADENAAHGIALPPNVSPQSPSSEEPRHGSGQTRGEPSLQGNAPPPSLSMPQYQNEPLPQVHDLNATPDTAHRSAPKKNFGGRKKKMES